MNDQLFYTLNTYLRKIGIHLHKEELRLQIASHPSYPSLHAVTGVLHHFNISNMAVEVPADRDTLIQLPEIFFTLADSARGREFVVAERKGENVVVYYGDKKKRTLSVEEFLGEWQGIIVVAEKDTYDPEEMGTGDRKLLNTLGITGGVLLLAAFFYAGPPLFRSLHFLLSLAGIAASVLIIRHELGFRSGITDTFCSSGKTTNCDTVLNSAGARVWGTVKLSDLGLVYFAGLSLFWILPESSFSGYSTVAVLSLLTFPVTLYSIYYQYKVAKKWCPLCLAVVAVLWLQAASLLTPGFAAGFTVNGAFALLSCFVVMACLWLFLKPLLKQQPEFRELQVAHYRFKRNFDLFRALYGKKEMVDTKLAGIPEIVLGRKDAPVQVVLVTNPGCFYCKEAHRDIDRLLDRHPGKIRVSIRFNIGVRNAENAAYSVAARLMEIYGAASEEECRKALAEAYSENADPGKWLLKWRMPGNDFDKVLEQQQKWCHDNGINFTPALFVNGRPFPEEYDRADLDYFTEDLAEERERTGTGVHEAL